MTGNPTKSKDELPDTNVPMLWHHDLHHTTAGERLYYVFLAVRPFQQENVLTVVKGQLERRAVLSFAIWELFGEWDLLIRLWLKAPADIGDLRHALRNELRIDTHDVREAHFCVESFECHSMIADTDDRVAERAEEVIEKADKYRVVSAIAPKRRQQYVEQGLATRTGNAKPTLKIFMAIATPPDANFGENAVENTLRRYREILQESRLTDVALFRGTGNGLFFISARISRGDMEEISRTIVQSLQGSGPVYGMSTSTFVASRSAPLVRREQLLQLPPQGSSFARVKQPTSEFIRGLLKRDESQTLEFKGTAFSPISPRVIAKSPRPRGASSSDIIDAVIKTIAAFLHTDGGLLVIGALERSKFAYEAVTVAYPKAREIGECIVVGLQGDKSYGGDWDEYSRKLSRTIEDRLSYGPGPFLRYTEISVNALQVCCIEVAPSSEDFWVSTKGERGTHFYKRLGNRTQELQGKDLAAELDRRRRARTLDNSKSF